jgi:hypothetical protein
MPCATRARGRRAPVDSVGETSRTEHGAVVESGKETMKETVLRKIVEKNTMPPPLTARDGWRSTNARYWRSFFARSQINKFFRKTLDPLARWSKN